MIGASLVLDERAAHSAAHVGGKAANLSRLLTAGLPVPAFVVLPTEAFAAVNSPMLANTEPSAVHPPDDAILTALAPHLSRLTSGGHRLAVRSSSPDEDGKSSSFAGLLESVVDVEPDDMADAVHTVWRSACSPRVQAYRRQHDMGDVLPPAVIVQRMLQPSISGVAFGADPVSGSRKVCVIAAVRGNAVPLVDGSADGQTWYVSHDDFTVSRRPDDRAAPLLNDEQLRLIRTLCSDAGDLFNCPQDIEWALEGDKIWVVQSRPITTLPSDSSEGPRRVWDNANISESYGGITTPLTFTFARTAYSGVYRAFCRLMAVPQQRIAENDDLFDQMLGLFQGRVYYNLYNWYRLIAMLPGYQSNRQFMEQMMGVREPMPDEVLRDIPAMSWRGRLRDRLDLCRSALGLLRRYTQLGGMTKRFEARVDSALKLSGRKLEGMRLDELVSHYRELQAQLLTRWDAPLVNDFYTMICFGLLRSKAERWLGEEGWAMVSRQLSGAEGMVSVEPARQIEAMGRTAVNIPGATQMLQHGEGSAIAQLLSEHSDLHDMVKAYIDRFGDRCMEELKLETATLRENATPLWRAIGMAASRAASRSDDSPSADPVAQQVSNDALHIAMAGKPIKRIVLNRLIRKARHHLVLRENLRFERTRVFGRVRQIMVQIGQRLAAAGVLCDVTDVFYLEIDEVLGFVEGNLACDDLQSVAHARRAAFDQYRAQPAPPERFETRGAASMHTAGGFNVVARPTSTVDATHDGALLHGIGCYPGVVRAQVVRVLAPTEAPPIAGKILVAERTDPGWVMLFPGAAGVLVQRGSILSHSATLARELRIPTIVAVPGLMQTLADGDWIEMDGAAGIVRRIDTQVEEARATSRRNAG